MSFTGSFREVIKAKIDSAHGLVTPTADMTRNTTSSYDSATTYFTADTTLTGASDSYDLAGSLTDDLGDVIVFKEVHLIHFKNQSAVASARNMIVGSALTHIPLFKASAHAMIVPPQCSFTVLNDTGIPVTAGTADTINIFGTSGDAYELVIIGRRT